MRKIVEEVSGCAAHTSYWKKYMSEVRSWVRGEERLSRLRYQAIGKE